MYNWRNMTVEQRDSVLSLRKLAKRPWHSPPHRLSARTTFHLTAATYEHRHVIGQSAERMDTFEQELLAAVTKHGETLIAWCVLPNHYHLLLDAPQVAGTLYELGRLHGRSSCRWNKEDCSPGRKCWNCVSDRAMRTERHRWATLNYVMHNPVHHGYSQQWQDWPYSNAAAYLESIGRAEAERRWQEYPLYDYGKGWDDASL